MSLVAISAAVALASVDGRALEQLERVLRAWAGVQTLTYRLDKVERMRDGEVVRESVSVKVRKPDSFYTAALEPRAGQEVIYVGSRDRGHLIVHPGRFPDLTLTLDIRGSLATEKQHHLVTHSGFGYVVAGLLKSLKAAHRSEEALFIRYEGLDVLFGRRVQRVTLRAGNEPAVRIRAQSGESLFDFADRVGQDAYLIYYVNPTIEELTDDLDARDYLVPATYGARAEWLLDAEIGLPLRISFWDAEGRLYERYDYRDLRINPPLRDLDFDPENPAYDF